jgi:tripartite-type tricarboxylate transporter receptor subunit TctC
MLIFVKLAVALLSVGAAMVPVIATAQTYPTKPITLVVGFAAGGSSDVLSRILAEKMAQGLGQPVVVENRPGVASIVGAAFVAKARPDGYTVLMSASGPGVFNHALYPKLPYAPQDLVPISLVGTFPLLLLVNSNHPAKTVAELVAYSKQNPDKANYAASSASFQLITELFNSKTGARFTHIPYKGSNDSITAVISGDVTMTLVDAGAASPALQGGRVKALAVTSAERLKELPNTPTLSELGVDLNVVFWSGLMAPAGTPAAVIKRLQDEVARVVNLPEVRQRISGLSITPGASSSEDFARLLAQEIPLWKQVALDNNIKAN